MAKDPLAKYTSERIAAIRKDYDQDVQWWGPIREQRRLDMQCISTEQGPWPDEEWKARHKAGEERPCFHEDVLTQYINTVANQLEANHRGVKVEPTGLGAGTETATYLEGRIRAICYDQNEPLVVQTASRTAVEGSYGWFKLETVYSGKDKQKQKFTLTPFLDPDMFTPGFFKKPDASDMRRGWEHERMTHEEFRQRFPDAKIQSFEGLELDAPKFVDAMTVLVVAFWHLEEDERVRFTINDPNGDFDIYEDELDDDHPIDAKQIKKRSIVKTGDRKVLKTLFNGLEALEETEWIDPGNGDDCPPEIPIFLISGRIKFQDGKMTIDSLPRKGRVGNLLYDYLITTIHETIAITGKPVRVGPEGTFDTATNWNPRSITSTKEYKPVIAENGQVLDPPKMEFYEAPIAALEQAKMSILIGIQNAIGMSSTERKDRAAKSGKALEQMQTDMQTSTAHYYSASGGAQTRFYKMVQRCLPLIDAGHEHVPVRDKYGKHSVVPPMASAYETDHSVTISVGKYYQSQEEEDTEFAEELAKIGDPNVLLLVLPGICRMKGGSPYAEQIAESIEAINMKMHPELDGVYNKGKENPQQTAKLKQQAQQMQQALQALNAHSKQLEQQIIQLQDEQQAKVLDLKTKAEMNRDDNATKVQVAEIQASTKESITNLETQLEAMKHISDVLTQHTQMLSANQQQNQDRQTQVTQAATDRQHEMAMQGQQHSQALEQQQQAADLAPPQETAQ